VRHAEDFERVLTLMMADRFNSEASRRQAEHSRILAEMPAPITERGPRYASQWHATTSIFGDSARGLATDVVALANDYDASADDIMQLFARYSDVLATRRQDLLRYLQEFTATEPQLRPRFAEEMERAYLGSLREVEIRFRRKAHRQRPSLRDRPGGDDQMFEQL
jgi:hypothetical protein